jgi:hypothetical protein
MTERKQTPDILGAILSGATPPGQPSAPPPVTAPPAAQVAPAAPPPIARAERAPRASATRQTSWEYLIVSFHEQNGWHARFVNGREMENWQRGPQLHDVLDQLGGDGWELINVVKSEPLYGTMDRLQAYFKRPQ